MSKELPKSTGALPDTRNNAQKSKDWKHSEVVASTSLVVWKEKSFNDLAKFPERFQDSSSSCMAQSGVKNLGIANYSLTNFFPILSALPIYRNRSNFPSEGMTLPDLFSLLVRGLSCFEDDKKSQNLTEAQMNVAVSFSNKELVDAMKYKADGYFYLEEPYNIEDFATIISSGRSIELMVFFEDDEYWKPRPEILREVTLYGSKTRRHGIVASEFLLIDGKKYLFCEDSAGNWTGINGKGFRYISEEFLLKRCFGAGYLIKKAYTVPSKPKYHFTKMLTYGMKNDKDVAALQSILQYEGFMPTKLDGEDFVPTGNFLGMTAQALIKWQIAHNMPDFQYETNMTKVRFGKKSIATANLLYMV
jgi:hypothetical protein